MIANGTREFNLRIETESLRRKTPRIVLNVNGEQVSIQDLNLSAPRSCSAYARQISELYSLSFDRVIEELGKLSTWFAAEKRQQERQLREQQAASSRLCDYIIAAIMAMKPIAKNRTKRMTSFESESWPMRAEDLLAHLISNTEFVDGVSNTFEGLEAAANGRPLQYLARVQHIKGALPSAIMRVWDTLPDDSAIDSEQDAQLQSLTTKTVAFLLKVRTARKSESQTFTTSLFEWASRVKPGSGWQKFQNLQVYAKRDTDPQPVVGVNSNFLADELRFDSAKAFVTLAKSVGLGDVVQQRVEGTVTRMFLLDPSIVQECLTLDIDPEKEDDTDDE